VLLKAVERIDAAIIKRGDELELALYVEDGFRDDLKQLAKDDSDITFCEY